MKILLYYLLSISLSWASMEDKAEISDPFSYSYYQHYTYTNLQSQIKYHQYIVNPVTGREFSPETKQISFKALVHFLQIKDDTINVAVWQANHQLFSNILYQLHYNQSFINLRNNVFELEKIIDQRLRNLYFFICQEFENKQDKNIRKSNYSYADLKFLEEYYIQSAKKTLNQYYCNALYIIHQTLLN